MLSPMYLREDLILLPPDAPFRKWLLCDKQILTIKWNITANIFLCGPSVIKFLEAYFYRLQRNTSFLITNSQGLCLQNTAGEKKRHMKRYKFHFTCSGSWAIWVLNFWNMLSSLDSCLAMDSNSSSGASPEKPPQLWKI